MPVGVSLVILISYATYAILFPFVLVFVMSILYHRGVTRLVTVPDYYSFFLGFAGVLFSSVPA